MPPRRPRPLSWLLALLLVAVALPFWAGAEAPAAGSGTIVYQPPRRGAPRARIGGATRGSHGSQPVVAVLAPDHVGLTSQDQPDLFWYISQPVTQPVELAIIDPERPAPLLEERLDGVPRAGIQRWRLAGHSLRLAPGKEYQWSVAMVLDPAHRSQDLVAGGMIERLPPDPTAAPPPAPTALAAVAYAQEGVWYDALTCLANLADRLPDDPAPRLLRAELLDQIGLPELATLERTAAADASGAAGHRTP
ncbi:MAG: DUF928 domain-containing protein [Thermodesulfobacteriota bacterium]